MAESRQSGITNPRMSIAAEQLRKKTKQTPRLHTQPTINALLKPHPTTD